MTSLAVVTPSAALMPLMRSVMELATSAAGYAAQGRADRTTREYAKLWRAFSEWCSARELRSLPCEPVTLALYFTERADAGVLPASLQVAISAIARHHKQAGFVPPDKHPAFQAVWQGIRRSRGVAPRRRVAAACIDELRRMVATLPRSVKGKRDRAILTLCFSGAFRRSELVVLMIDDVTFYPDGMVVMLRRSKGDQESQGVPVEIPRGRVAAICPMRTLRAWLEAAGKRDVGPLFCSVDRYGRIRGRALHGHNVATIVKETAAAAGLDPRQYSGHSLRAGLATSAAKAGKSILSIQQQCRWRSPASAVTYVRDGQRFGDFNAAKGL